VEEHADQSDQDGPSMAPDKEKGDMVYYTEQAGRSLLKMIERLLCVYAMWNKQHFKVMYLR